MFLKIWKSFENFRGRFATVLIFVRNIYPCYILNYSFHPYSFRTHGYSGADLENLCKEAALHAMTTAGLENVSNVSWSDFKEVFQTFCPSLNAEMLEAYEKLSLHF